MPVSLSRIEREYVIQNLSEILPSLSLLCGQTLYLIQEKQYSITNGILCGIDSISEIQSGSTIRVFFRHKQRGMYFNCSYFTGNDGQYSISLDVEFFKDDFSINSDPPVKAVVTIQDQIYEAFSTSSLPLDSIIVDPQVCHLRKESLQKIIERAGIPPSCSLLSYRLFDYLDGFRINHRSVTDRPHFGQLIFIDSRFCFISLLSLRKPFPEVTSLVSLTVTYSKRYIFVEGVIQSCIPVNSSFTILVLDIGSAQKEDKRFLYEKLYKEKYTE